MTTAQHIKPIVAPSPVVASGSSQRPRLESIDILRGLVMVFMALDHVKHTFMAESFDPMNPDVTTFGYYMTRWITHFCAPTFCFLMGVGAYLAGRRGKTKAELFWFLFSRGVWLLILEFTIVKLGMFFQYNTNNWAGVVYWSLGSCLVFLSLLVFLPPRVVAAIGIALILFHNLFDGVKANDLGPLRPFWVILHSGGSIELMERLKLNHAYLLAPWFGSIAAGDGLGAISWGMLQAGDRIELVEGIRLHVAYPLVPWIGVVAAGYGFGSVYNLEARRRQKIMLLLGLALTVGFFGLRYTNLYGDPNPWSAMSTEIKASSKIVDGETVIVPPKPSAPRTALQTAFSFLNTHKYPPSLLFLLMTLGPALIALGLLEKYPLHDGLTRILLTFGRVPLFYWVIHWFIIGFLVRGITLARGFSLLNVPGMPPPDEAKYGLPMVYFWVFVVLCILYFPCRWFEGVKARNKNVWWLSYL